MLSVLYRRLLAFVKRDRFEQDLEDELNFHLAMRQAEHEDGGLPGPAAAAATRRRFGNVGLIKERARDEWLPPAVQALGQDLRFAGRLLVKDRRFTLAAVAALSLGIGVNTTAFTIVRGALFTALPYDRPEQLVTMETVDARRRPMGVSYADVRDWRTSTTKLSQVVSSLDFAMNISDETAAPTRYMGSFIGIDAFRMLGRAPVLGRPFLPEDDVLNAPRVAIIADSVWKSRYHADPAVVGRTVRINEQPATIIGVMPEDIRFPQATEVWMPAALAMGPAATIDNRRGNRVTTTGAYGRLADGVTLAQAQAEMDAITGRLARDYPATNAGISVALRPIEQMYRGGGLAQILWLAQGAVAFVLIIACVNVANLLLARAATRAREIAIRATLGATRRRIVRQLLIESALLATVSSAVGFALSIYGTRLFANAMIGINEGPPPFWMHFTIDRSVVIFLASVSIATTLLFGMAPALHLSRDNVNGAMKDGGRGATSGPRARRWTGALVAAQLALTVVLLAGAGLMLRSFLVVYQAGRALDTTNLLTMRLAFGSQRYRLPEPIKQFFTQLDERLTSNPTFTSATMANDIPLMTLANATRQLTIAGRTATPDDAAAVGYAYTGRNYFETLGLRLTRGSGFTEQSGLPGQEEAIVNQRFVAMFFPEGEVIGQRIQLANAATPSPQLPWYTIVGIVPTLPQFVATSTPEPMVYVPVQSEPAPIRFASVMVRYKGETAAAIAALRDDVRKVDPDMPGYFVATMDQALANGRTPFRLFGSAFGLIAMIALVLASVGLYAVTAQGVIQRTHEIGVRMALGAESRQVVTMFLRRTAVHIAAGLALGLAGAVAVGRLLEPLLVRTAPTDPAALATVSLLLIIVAVSASFWPARRAARVNPVAALHTD